MVSTALRSGPDSVVELPPIVTVSGVCVIAASCATVKLFVANGMRPFPGAPTTETEGDSGNGKCGSGGGAPAETDVKKSAAAPISVTREIR